MSWKNMGNSEGCAREPNGRLASMNSQRFCLCFPCLWIADGGCCSQLFLVSGGLLYWVFVVVVVVFGFWFFETEFLCIALELELRNPPASASRVLGVKACATMPGGVKRMMPCWLVVAVTGSQSVILPGLELMKTTLALNLKCLCLYFPKC